MKQIRNQKYFSRQDKFGTNEKRRNEKVERQSTIDMNEITESHLKINKALYRILWVSVSETNITMNAGIFLPFAFS